jgi:hypothetical protein
MMFDPGICFRMALSCWCNDRWFIRTSELFLQTLSTPLVCVSLLQPNYQCGYQRNFCTNFAPPLSGNLTFALLTFWPRILGLRNIADISWLLEFSGSFGLTPRLSAWPLKILHGLSVAASARAQLWLCPSLPSCGHCAIVVSAEVAGFLLIFRSGTLSRGFYTVMTPLALLALNGPVGTVALELIRRWEMEFGRSSRKWILINRNSFNLLYQCTCLVGSNIDALDRNFETSRTFGVSGRRSWHFCFLFQALTLYICLAIFEGHGAGKLVVLLPWRNIHSWLRWLLSASSTMATVLCSMPHERAVITGKLSSSSAIGK